MECKRDRDIKVTESILQANDLLIQGVERNGSALKEGALHMGCF